MKYIIHGQLLQKQDLTLRQLGILIYLAADAKITELKSDLEDLWNKGYVEKDGNGNYIFSAPRWEDVKISIEKDASGSALGERCVKLAKQLKEIYPKGNRIIGDKKYPFQEAERIIAQRLMKFFSRYGEDYNDEDIVNVTKTYVEQFEDDKTYMKSLKYFIFKDDNKTDGYGKGYVDEQSLLLTFLENPEEATKSINNFIKMR